MADFDDCKQAVLQGLASEVKDKSRASGVDAPIATLIDRNNWHPHYFTTSSCSGHISIFSESAPDDGGGHYGRTATVGKKTKKKERGTPLEGFVAGWKLVEAQVHRERHEESERFRKLFSVSNEFYVSIFEGEVVGAGDGRGRKLLQAANILDDQTALLLFKQRITLNPNWTLQGWNTNANQDHCVWTGVTYINITGQVIGFNLTGGVMVPIKRNGGSAGREQRIKYAHLSGVTGFFAAPKDDIQ